MEKRQDLRVPLGFMFAIGEGRKRIVRSKDRIRKFEKIFSRSKRKEKKREKKRGEKEKKKKKKKKKEEEEGQE
ncbi:hypothetical protein HZH68_012829 [Vespula germanica]|uniref:Uncharacterized protein n=1 Tax=Vespula germanica TaxID=30212 RepID=A0A834MVS9_VESGE|nr:hypothetical protein HZH68_012829 [Vespula germanica]